MADGQAKLIWRCLICFALIERITRRSTFVGVLNMRALVVFGVGAAGVLNMRALVVLGARAA